MIEPAEPDSDHPDEVWIQFEETPNRDGTLGKFRRLRIGKDLVIRETP